MTWWGSGVNTELTHGGCGGLKPPAKKPYAVVRASARFAL